MEQKRYINPPIKEVLCEIRFSRNSKWDPTIPGLFFERLRERFPYRNKGKDIETELVIRDENVQPKVTLSERAVFQNEDKNINIQIGTHYLAISHLAPYTNWDNYVSVILEAVNTYIDIAKPKQIERIELRHINEFSLEIFNYPDKLNLEEYFDFYPYIGNEGEMDYDSFIVGIQTRYGDNVQRIQMTNNDNGIVLDTTYFSGKPNIIAFDQIPLWLEDAHKKNNYIFEGTIKEPLRKMFGEVDGNEFNTNQ